MGKVWMNGPYHGAKVWKLGPYKLNNPASEPEVWYYRNAGKIELHLQASDSERMFHYVVEIPFRARRKALKID